MKPLLLFAAVLLLYSKLSAQEEPAAAPKKIIPSAATIKLTDGSIAKGWLYHLNDSQVVLLQVPGKRLKHLQEPNQTSTISIEQIHSIALRKKNSVMKGTLIGLGAGVLTGVIIGFAGGDDKIQPYPDPASDPLGLGALVTAFGNSFAMTAGEKALVGGLGLGTVGALTGALIGALTKKKFIIGGKKQTYRDLQGDLMRRLIIQ